MKLTFPLAPSTLSVINRSLLSALFQINGIGCSTTVCDFLAPLSSHLERVQLMAFFHYVRPSTLTIEMFVCKVLTQLFGFKYMRYCPNILQLQVFILFIQYKLSSNQDFKVILWIKKTKQKNKSFKNIVQCIFWMVAFLLLYCCLSQRPCHSYCNSCSLFTELKDISILLLKCLQGCWDDIIWNRLFCECKFIVTFDQLNVTTLNKKY